MNISCSVGNGKNKPVPQINRYRFIRGNTLFVRLFVYSYCSISFSRVHITKATRDALGSDYEVEPGDGADRNKYLAEKEILTFFVVPKQNRAVQNA